MSDQSENPTQTPQISIEAAIEALLFVAASSVTVAQMAETLHVKQAEIEETLKRMDASYDHTRGLRLQWHNGRVQLTTAPETAALIETFLGLDATARLSRAGLETLAIISYRQPITRPGIDAIRGVSSDGVLKSLLSKGLVQEVGRSEGPGRPILYGTTSEFLQHFGLSSIAAMPPFEQAAPESEKEENLILKD